MKYQGTQVTPLKQLRETAYVRPLPPRRRGKNTRLQLSSQSPPTLSQTHINDGPEVRSFIEYIADGSDWEKSTFFG